MEDAYFKKISTVILLVALIVLSFFLLKPVLLSIITGLILVFIFTPVYDFLFKHFKSKNLAATICCVVLILIIVLPIWLLTPIVIDQSIKIYLSAQEIDLVTPLKNIFPSLLASDQFSSEVGSITQSFISKSAISLMNYFSDFILNFPQLALQFIVVLFTFFFVLKDKENLASYLQGLMPFPKDIEKKLVDSTKGIAASVIYGQIIIGLLQGIITGLGFIIFKVPNALILTLLATFAGIFPIIGPAFVWIPVVVYLFVTGNNLAAIGVLVFGAIASTSDNFLRPMIVSRRTRLSTPLVLIGMIGGLFFFGIIGLILGPIIIAYLFIVLEAYKHKKTSVVLIEEPAKKSK